MLDITAAPTWHWGPGWWSENCCSSVNIEKLKRQCSDSSNHRLWPKWFHQHEAKVGNQETLIRPWISLYPGLLVDGVSKVNSSDYVFTDLDRRFLIPNVSNNIDHHSQYSFITTIFEQHLHMCRVSLTTQSMIVRSVQSGPELVTPLYISSNYVSRLLFPQILLFLRRVDGYLYVLLIMYLPAHALFLTFIFQLFWLC